MIQTGFNVNTTNNNILFLLTHEENDGVDITTTSQTEWEKIVEEI